MIDHITVLLHTTFQKKKRIASQKKTKEQSYLQNTTQKTKDRATRTPLNTGGEPSVPAGSDVP